jgi:hypothetical protein
MTTSRRTFLRGASGALALGLSGTARAGGGLVERTVPGSTTHFKVLEVFFAGGLSHRETLWVERPDEAPVVRRIGTLDPRTHPLLTTGAPPDWTAWLPSVGAHLGAEYRQGSAGGKEVHLGPCAEPLVRPNATGTRIADRLRVIATGHDLDVHGAAQEFMLQGSTAFSAEDRAAGVGAAIARHTGKRSYIFYASRLFDPAYAAAMAAVSGRHGTAPTQIPCDDPSFIDGLVGDPRIGPRDALSGHYTDLYEGGLVFAHPAAAGRRARSVAFDRYAEGQRTTFEGGSLASAITELTVSAGTTLWDNPTRRALKASIGILAANASSYCCVVDGGVAGDTFGGFSHYDSHGEDSFDMHAANVTGNVLNVLRTLREENDAGRLKLDETLVVLNTEFGRSFWKPTGSHHCWRGFAVALLGGPIPFGARGLVGALTFTREDDGLTHEVDNPAPATGGLLGPAPVSSTDLRAAVLQAAGIHPFQPDVYRQAEAGVPEGLSDDDAADRLATHLFGL